MVPTEPLRRGVRGAALWGPGGAGFNHSLPSLRWDFRDTTAHLPLFLFSSLLNSCNFFSKFLFQSPPEIIIIF